MNYGFDRGSRLQIVFFCMIVCIMRYALFSLEVLLYITHFPCISIFSSFRFLTGQGRVTTRSPCILTDPSANENVRRNFGSDDHVYLPCGTLIYHDTGGQFWSGRISLHQAPRISCLLDPPVRQSVTVENV